MNLDLLKALSKYPFVYESEFYDSVELAQNRTCSRKCIEKDCLSLLSSTKSEDHYICSKGYDNYLVTINELTFFINGLIFTGNRAVPKGRKDVRREYIFQKENILLFIRKLKAVEEHISLNVNETIEKNFSMFHDFKTSMSIMFSCAQEIINDLPGDSFEDKISINDKIYRDLYNSLELISSQLGMIDIIINPKSIEFGNKKTINLYRLFEKIKILFDHLTLKKRNISIDIFAETRIKDCNCFESIECIPLILLDNALKYSMPDSTVEIKFEQRSNSVKVIVKNIGPFVAEENESKIFDKFFRDPAAIEFSKEGIGMGLWIAQKILFAHNTSLKYYKDKNETRSHGLNIFEFDLETI